MRKNARRTGVTDEVLMHRNGRGVSMLSILLPFIFLIETYKAIPEQKAKNKAGIPA